MIRLTVRRARRTSARCCYRYRSRPTPPNRRPYSDGGSLVQQSSDAPSQRTRALSHFITCPPGLTGRIRGIKAREERILADRKLAKSGGQVDELLGACWEETLDPGPYYVGDKAIDWGAVLRGDRFCALLQVRALTYGLELAFALGYQNDG